MHAMYVFQLTQTVWDNGVFFFLARVRGSVGAMTTSNIVTTSINDTTMEWGSKVYPTHVYLSNWYAIYIAIRLMICNVYYVHLQGVMHKLYFAVKFLMKLLHRFAMRLLSVAPASPYTIPIINVHGSISLPRTTPI
jgi:hypothetical protein